MSASQLVVEHVTAPGVPDAPAATPHLVAHPNGSLCTQSPGIWTCDNHEINVQWKINIGPCSIDNGLLNVTSSLRMHLFDGVSGEGTCAYERVAEVLSI